MNRDYLIGTGLLLLAVGAILIRRNSSGGGSNNNNSNMFITDKNLPRGYRNNNPLNIRINSANNWLGKVPAANNSDGSFEQFITMSHGYRAGMITIRNIVLRGNKTVQQLIRVWAPDSDGNNSTRYAQRIYDLVGFPTDMVVDVNSREIMTNLVYAMSIVENGKLPSPDMKAIDDGWEMYLSYIK